VNEKHIIEVLIHSSSSPVKIKDIIHALNDTKIDIAKIISEINNEYKELNKGYRIDKIGGGYQFLSSPEYHPYIEKLHHKTKKNRFSKAAIEALSIIAYKQPITRVEIEHIRGVDCSGVVKNLLEKNLISIKGRDRGLGRALLYTTTPIFLELFGLDSIKDLPTLQELTQLIEEVENSSTPNLK